MACPKTLLSMTCRMRIVTGSARVVRKGHAPKVPLAQPFNLFAQAQPVSGIVRRMGALRHSDMNAGAYGSPCGRVYSNTVLPVQYKG